LKYWVELIQPNGQILRVSSARVFHSGEHVRLHFESNVDGRIVLVQMNANGTSQVLYPDPRINNGDNHIKAGSDMTVPAGGAWFTLDNNPGTERVMVFLNSESSMPVAAPQFTHSPGGPLPQSTANDSPVISPGGKLDASTTAELAAKVDQQRGSKSLILEMDDKSERPADYAVKPAVYKPGNPEGPAALAVMIQLKHQ
jgi:hypothetical protein